MEKQIIRSISSVKSLSCVQFFATPQTAARQASLPITNSQSLLKPKSIKSVIPSNHLILCHPFLLWPSVLPSIRVLSSESLLCIRWPKYWSFSPANEYSGLIFFTIGRLISQQSKGLSTVFSNTTVPKHQLFWCSLFFFFFPQENRKLYSNLAQGFTIHGTHKGKQVVSIFCGKSCS